MKIKCEVLQKKLKALRIVEKALNAVCRFRDVQRGICNLIDTLRVGPCQEAHPDQHSADKKDDYHQHPYESPAFFHDALSSL